MTQDNDVTGKRPWLRLNPLAMLAALPGAAAFAAALALVLVQVGRAPADYYGVLSWLAPEIGLGPLAILLGVIAAILARAAHDKRSAGIGLLGGGLAAAAVVVALTCAPPNAGSLNTRCMENMKAIAAALTMYETDHGALPPAAHWTRALSSYVHNPTVWKEPFTGKPGYALNAAIAGRRPDSFAAEPSSIIAVFESDRGANAAGGIELLPRRPRHNDGDVVGFLDGHIRRLYGLRAAQADDRGPLWDPDKAPAAASGANHPGARR